MVTKDDGNIVTSFQDLNSTEGIWRAYHWSYQAANTDRGEWTFSWFKIHGEYTFGAGFYPPSGGCYNATLTPCSTPVIRASS